MRRVLAGVLSVGTFLACGIVTPYGVGEARAGFTVALEGTFASGDETRFLYGASISDGESIVAGDFFRIYDFYGYVHGSIAAPAGWTATVETTSLLGSPAVLLSYGDDPAVENLVFTYTGATPIVGPISLSGFSAESVFPGASRTQNYAGLSTALVGKIGTVGSVTVPGIGPPYPAAVPEPSAIVSTTVGLGLLAWGGLRRRARRRGA